MGLAVLPVFAVVFAGAVVLARALSRRTNRRYRRISEEEGVPVFYAKISPYADARLVVTPAALVVRRTRPQPSKTDHPWPSLASIAVKPMRLLASAGTIDAVDHAGASIVSVEVADLPRFVDAVAAVPDAAGKVVRR